MATIKRRKNSFQIIVSCGYDSKGKQMRRTMTYKPKADMTEKQILKEISRQAYLFEEKCRNGQMLDDGIRLSEFSENWFEDCKKDLRPKTYERYKNIYTRIDIALGHMKLSQIQPQHIRAFCRNLAEGGIRLDTKYKCKIDITNYLRDNKITMAEFSRRSNVPYTTLLSVRSKNNVAELNANKISKAMGSSIENVFESVSADKPLADRTILHHYRLLANILHTAVEWGVLFSNPCDRTKPPKVGYKDPKYLDEVQSQQLLELLEEVPVTYKTAVRLLLFTGMRRGELLGLKRTDVDFENGLLHICRSLQYIPKKGIFEDKTKNVSSVRTIKLSQIAVADLKNYYLYQDEQCEKLGDRWNNKAGYIFTRSEGNPINPDSLSSWYSRFMKRHADVLEYSTLHSLRHTNATLQIASGVPITTVAKRLGHTSSNTTTRIYAHAISSADEYAAETLEDILNPKKNK